MKKYLIILSAAFLAVTGCMQFEPEVQLDKDSVSAPAINVVNVADEGFTATITPASGTSFYSYALAAGEAKEVAAKTIFKLGLSGSIKKGTFNAKENAGANLVFEGLNMDATYTLYAVAASELGCIGDVVYTTIHTSDSVIPALDDASISGTKVSLTFSEPVKYVGSGVSVKYYAVNSNDIFENKPVAEVEDFTVNASGKVVTIDCGTMPNGAHFTVSYDEGTFVDAVGNGCVAMNSMFGKTADGKLGSAGLAGRKATAAFKIDIYGGQPVTVVSNMASPIWISVPDDFKFYSSDYKAAGTIVYETVEEGHSITESYDIYGGHPDYGYGWNGTYNCALTYPNAGMTSRPNPARGSMVTLTIPSFLTDIYGNKNEPLVIGPFLYSYGYTLIDVLGKYEVEATSYFNGPSTFTMTIAQSDDAKKGNVMFTEMFGDPLDSDLRLYANFNCDTGVLTIPDWQKLWYAQKYAGYWMFAINGADQVTLNMAKAGTLTDPSAWFGYYIDIDNGGWGDIFTTFSAVKAEDQYVASISAKERTIVSPGKILR